MAKKTREELLREMEDFQNKLVDESTTPLLVWFRALSPEISGDLKRLITTGDTSAINDFMVQHEYRYAHPDEANRLCSIARAFPGRFKHGE